MKNIEKNYCENPLLYKRRKTGEVKIGNIGLGSHNPIRLQTMTNTLTSDIEATVTQCLNCHNAGADFVRITTPTIKDVEYLKEIKHKLQEIKYIPLVADIHFLPKAAELAAEFIEKVRINPGNYINAKGKLSYTNEEYAVELENIKNRIKPLLDICKKNNTAIRIGTNHGSLSERIMSRFGDTPEGMAEATMEFLRICKEEDFHNVVISLKASNTRVMVHSTRLLVKMMNNEQMDYPLHLGVTEAGEGEDGRIKSAVGIGALLADGIGDTIRVSLTEAPEAEIPVAKIIVQHFQLLANAVQQNFPFSIEEIFSVFEPYSYVKQQTTPNFSQPVVITKLNDKIPFSEALQEIGYKYNSQKKSFTSSTTAADYIFAESVENNDFPQNINFIVAFQNNEIQLPSNVFQLYKKENYIENPISEKLHFLEINYFEITPALIEKLKNDKNCVLIHNSQNITYINEFRAMYCKLRLEKIFNTVIAKRIYNSAILPHFQLLAAADNGVLFLDALADGLWIENNNTQTSKNKVINTAFGILQASRVRTTKTEYISCPSCGRTLFDLQSVTAQIRAVTTHLKNLKIAVMGCIVNGPGEMADADYGYVGSGKDKVTLYKKKQIMKANLPADKAVEELIKLIKENGDWQSADN